MCTANPEQPSTRNPEQSTTRNPEQPTIATRKPEQLTTGNPKQPTTRDPESVTTACDTITSIDVIYLTSTITNENHILWPNEEVIFTCETRGSILVNTWTSNDYIGDGISLVIWN